MLICRPLDEHDRYGAARAGDTIVVPSLDRLGRSVHDLIAMVSGLRKRGVGFTLPHEALDTHASATSGG
ncbi:recombinase family protein [Streptomyces halstedii]|uniref:recombinase family protein n=1 Tax=Streptomyces halstedii TaxID=1944 RepID=UPI0038008C94